MEQIRIFWTPTGVTLDQIGDKRFIDVVDGDTPALRMDVRMLSIDTPEKNKTNREIRNAEELEGLFAELANWIAAGDAPIAPTLGAYLAPKLTRADPVAHHIAQGKQATEQHKALVEDKLTRDNGRKRNLFVRVADKPFDRYGRLLAYVAPDYTAEERAKYSRRERATFNLMMVESGWAAPFIVYPNIPGELDLPMFRDSAREAIVGRRGAWADETNLIGFEFRALERLASVKKKLNAGAHVSARDRWGWLNRYALDMTTKQLFGPQGYHHIEPHNRIFIEPGDVRAAVTDLGLEPAPPELFGAVSE